MAPGIPELVAAGRQAAARGDWPRVAACAAELSRQAPHEAEGHFLTGLAARALNRPADAIASLERATALDARRGDAAVELAGLYVADHRYREARDLLARFRDSFRESPRYLDIAGSLYMAMSLHTIAFELFERANALQPGVDVIEMHLAASAVYVGRFERAEEALRSVLGRNPDHQRAHYELAQLRAATDRRHVDEMQASLSRAPRDPARNIFLYYALGKELEDLGDWDAAFDCYARGGAAARAASRYEVAEDVGLIDTIIETCTPDWLVTDPAPATAAPKTPIFVVGLPRTGTTLAERILSSHSQVESAGETQFLQMVLRGGNRANSVIGITPAQVRAAAARAAPAIAAAYLDAVSYRLGEAPYFTEKLPENVLYLGFVAKAFPNAPIVHLRRDPMDACFALFKQSYFRFAYTLEDLAEYYLAYDRLTQHWRAVLAARVVEVRYEDLVGDVEGEVRRLLAAVGLSFEAACLDFAGNAAPVATASAAQVRSGVHTHSVGKWRRFEKQLEPLRRRLAAAGVNVGESRKP